MNPSTEAYGRLKGWIQPKPHPILERLDRLEILQTTLLERIDVLHVLLGALVESLADEEEEPSLTLEGMQAGGERDQSQPL